MSEAADPPSRYHEQKALEANPSRPPARAIRETQLSVEIKRVRKENFGVYGARKVRRQPTRSPQFVALVEEVLGDENAAETGD